MMKKFLCLLLTTFALSLVVPPAEAAVVKAKPTLVKASKKNKSAKHKKHRKHGRKHRNKTQA